MALFEDGFRRGPPSVIGNFEVLGRPASTCIYDNSPTRTGVTDCTSSPCRTRERRGGRGRGRGGGSGCCSRGCVRSVSSTGEISAREIGPREIDTRQYRVNKTRAGELRPRQESNLQPTD